MKNMEREYWVDNVKMLACILVVLGHFFQSMTKANIVEGNAVYEWFKRTIYFFHVPLFFICSGYLYQKYSKIKSCKDWIRNVLNKLIALGIPYVVFSTATWVLKTVFSKSVNDEIGGLGEILFFKPTSPYWYLYVLFFLFLVVPNVKNKKRGFYLLSGAFVLKIMAVLGYVGSIYIIMQLCENAIWFIGGMVISFFPFKNENKKNKYFLGSVIIGFFLVMSIAIQCMNIAFPGMSFMMGVLACVGIIICMRTYTFYEKQSVMLGIATKYTMPIFLMHTLFAAPVRTVLLKLGVTSGTVHILVGLLASFLGPVVAMILMEKTKWLAFFVYPNRFIKIKRRD